MAVQLLAPHDHNADAHLPKAQTQPLNPDELPAPLARIVERLHLDHPTVSLAELNSLVRRCRRDIDTGAPEDCIPELVERLAQARLTHRTN